jgi:hypothetical protein
MDLIAARSVSQSGLPREPTAGNGPGTSLVARPLPDHPPHTSISAPVHRRGEEGVLPPPVECFRGVRSHRRMTQHLCDRFPWTRSSRSSEQNGPSRALLHSCTAATPINLSKNAVGALEKAVDGGAFGRQ